MQHQPHFPQLVFQKLRRRLGKLPDGINPNTAQLALCGRTNIEQIGCWQRIDNFFIVIPLDTGDGVRLFIVTTQLRRDLIVGNADAGGDPQLKLDPLADLFSNTHGRTEQTDAAGHIQPAFIKAKRFDLVGVFLVNLASHLTESDILTHIGRQHHQIGTKLLRLPDSHAGFDATWLCYIVGSKDDSVTGLRITADCHRLLPQFRAPLTFHRCIKCVHIYV